MSLHLGVTEGLSEDNEGSRNCPGDVEAENISALLRSIQLYRQIFPSTVLSVPSRGDDGGCNAKEQTRREISPPSNRSLIPHGEKKPSKNMRAGVGGKS